MITRIIQKALETATETKVEIVLSLNKSGFYLLADAAPDDAEVDYDNQTITLANGSVIKGV